MFCYQIWGSSYGVGDQAAAIEITQEWEASGVSILKLACREAATFG
jgi:hypothetical protein